MTVPRQRKPRFIPCPASWPISLTERDVRILSLVGRYRLIHSRHLSKLLQGSRQHLVRRLGKLFHAGYLRRPRAQLFLAKRTSGHFVYSLSRLGQRLLEDGSVPTFAAPPRIRGSDTMLSLPHALRVTDVLASFEAHVSSSSIRFVAHHEWEKTIEGAKSKSLRQLRWCVTSLKTAPKPQCTVIPDGAFALAPDGKPPSYFVLEVDRGTMPVSRSDATQTSFLRKVLAYKATRDAGVLWKRFRISGFRVLVVAESEGRLASLRAATASTFRNGDSSMFLFAVASALLGEADVLAHAWQTFSGRPVRLMEGRPDIPSHPAGDGYGVVK